MPLNEFVHIINEELKGLVPGMQVFGIAETVMRGSEPVPAIVNITGDYQYVGIDDIKSLIIYHRVGSVSIKRGTVRGFGDEPNNYVNTYQMGMIVYMDMKRTALTPDALLLYIQARMPGMFKVDPYPTDVIITLNNVILNGRTVWAAEYGDLSFKLPAERTLMQINYTIESQVRVACFEKCPEVC
jgi:hypothetical protein